MPKIQSLLPESLDPGKKPVPMGSKASTSQSLLGFSDREVASKAILPSRSRIGLLSDFQGLVHLSEAPYLSIAQSPGLSKVKALQISAVFELSKRLEKAAFIESANSLSASEVYARYHQGEPAEEGLVLLILNHKGEIIKERQLEPGSSSAFEIPKKKLVVELLVNYASSYILAHNHPSGNPLPSEEDIKKTLQLATETKSLGITLRDHIVMGSQGYYSFKESHLL
jgi:DNA repair protein RadC